MGFRQSHLRLLSHLPAGLEAPQRFLDKVIYPPFVLLFVVQVVVILVLVLNPLWVAVHRVFSTPKCASQVAVHFARNQLAGLGALPGHVPLVLGIWGPKVRSRCSRCFPPRALLRSWLRAIKVHGSAQARGGFQLAHTTGTPNASLAD